MTEIAILRMKILFNLNFNFDGVSFIHERGIQVSKIETLSDVEFLKIIEFITDKQETY